MTKYRHKISTVWTYFAVRLTFRITEFKGKNPGHSKLRLLLKYLFVKSNKNRIPLCALTPVFGPSASLFPPGFRPFRAQIDTIQCPLFLQLRYQYNFHPMTMMNNSTTFGNFFKNTFRCRSW